MTGTYSLVYSRQANNLVGGVELMEYLKMIVEVLKFASPRVGPAVWGNDTRAIA